MTKRLTGNEVVTDPVVSESVVKGRLRRVHVSGFVTYAEVKGGEELSNGSVGSEPAAQGNGND